MKVIEALRNEEGFLSLEVEGPAQTAMFSAPRLPVVPGIDLPTTAWFNALAAGTKAILRTPGRRA